MKFIIRLAFAMTLPMTSMAQVILSTGTQIAASQQTSIVIVTPSDVVNSTDFDFSSVDLALTLNGQNQEVVGNITAQGLTLNGTIIDLTGNLSVTSQLDFVTGVIRVPDDSNFSFSGEGTNLTVDCAGSSYVDGKFTQAGTGFRRFPVGDGTSYLPLEFADVKTSAPVTVQGFATGSGIVPQLSIKEVDQTRHWRITSDDFDNIKSKVSLYATDLSFEQGAVVVEADDSELLALSLASGGRDNGMVSSARNITKALLAIGRTNEVKLIIHDLLTPYDAGSANNSGNDVIQVDNLFPDNKIVLMDRWGVVLKEWTNYDQDTADPSFFQTLSPGNYICIVETWDNSNPETPIPYNATQMVTVLKTK